MPATTPQTPARKAPPAVGDRVMYRLKFNAELVPATVIDHMETDAEKPQRLQRPKAGTVHLRIELDPERHFSSSEYGYRMDVPEATAEEPHALNTFVREKPADEDKWFAELEYRRGVELEIRRRLARGQDPLITQ